MQERCQSIELLLADVDGVLTDGRVIVNNQGIETKQFHIRDGLGIRLWQKTGYRFGVVSLRSSQVVKMRAVELEVGIVRQGAVDKLATTLEILAEHGLTPQQACYIATTCPTCRSSAPWGLAWPWPMRWPRSARRPPT